MDLIEFFILQVFVLDYFKAKSHLHRITYVELHHSKSFICLSLYSERQMNDFEWCNST